VAISPFSERFLQANNLTTQANKLTAQANNFSAQANNYFGNLISMSRSGMKPNAFRITTQIHKLS
jgi:hypothetical protein